MPHFSVVSDEKSLTVDPPLLIALAEESILHDEMTVPNSTTGEVSGAKTTMFIDELAHFRIRR